MKSSLSELGEAKCEVLSIKWVLKNSAFSSDLNKGFCFAKNSIKNHKVLACFEYKPKDMSMILSKYNEYIAFIDTVVFVTVRYLVYRSMLCFILSFMYVVNRNLIPYMICLSTEMEA